MFNAQNENDADDDVAVIYDVLKISAYINKGNNIVRRMAAYKSIVLLYDGNFNDFIKQF